MSKKVTPEVSDDFLEEHLPYEVHMLRSTFLLLQLVGRKSMLTNALIESFCIHARNLIEFFFQMSDHCHFDPKDFAGSGYEPQKIPDIGSWYGMISQQVSHLTRHRTRIDEKKINGQVRSKILSALEDEIKSFRRHLKPKYRKKFKVEQRQNPTEADSLEKTIAVSDIPTATGAITDSKSK